MAAEPNPTLPSRTPVFALVGNPNCGKSTLFNALTGLKQKVGNYPGVTVEKKLGTAYSQHGLPLTVIDLPGAYSLAARSPDEAVTRDVLLGRRPDTPTPDRILCIVDATNSSEPLTSSTRSSTWAARSSSSSILMDLAAKGGLTVRVARLEKELGIPVIPARRSTARGCSRLKLAMSRTDLPLSRHAWNVPAAIAGAVTDLQASLAAADGKAPLSARARRSFCSPTRTSSGSPAPTPSVHARAHDRRFSAPGRRGGRRRDGLGRRPGAGALRRDRQAGRRGRAALPGRASAQRPDRRRRTIHSRLGLAPSRATMARDLCQHLHAGGVPMNWTRPPRRRLRTWVKARPPAGDLRDLVTDGAIPASAASSFSCPDPHPVFLHWAPGNTGYMARPLHHGPAHEQGRAERALLHPAAQLLRLRIPGIMATRTIEDPKDRLATILVAPLMSCSARLPVYLLMIAAPSGDRCRS